MSGEKYVLVLTGRPLDGYRTEEAVVALSRLLRIPRKNARNLLRGKPSRIRREFDKAKAVHLMSKVIACGAQCEIAPSESQEEGNQQVAASIELSAKLELEFDPPVMALEEVTLRTDELDRTEAMPGDRPPLQSGFDSTEATAGELPADRESRSQPRQTGSAAAISGDAGSTRRRARQRLLLSTVIGALLLVLLGWIGLNFFGGSPPAPQPDATAETPARQVAPATDSAAAKTRQRLDLLGRSVKIWMIQYGAGFDPSQVTMARMQQDLGISPEEMEDGWGTPFQYVTAEQRYTLISAGPDRTFGTVDDIKEEKSSR